MLAKKYLLVGIITLLSLSIANAAPPAVHPTTGEPLVIDCLKGTPKAIDGDLSDWNLNAMVPAVLDVEGQINSGQASWDNAEDCSGQFYLMWDDVNIYMAVVVKDDKLSMNKSAGDIWNADCIEVFFATTNAVSGHDEHYQYGFNANNQRWNWCNMDSAGYSEPDYLQIASSETDDGYICEASIEYGRMTALDFSVGNAIGFHPVIDDTDNGDREIQMTWTSREAHDQTLGYGHMILSAKSPIARVFSKNPRPANGAVNVLRDTDLSWEAGDFAISHDLYFGTDFDDVNTAALDDGKGVLLGQDLTDTTFDPGRLEFDQTYYWRVDEVNAPPDSTIFKGEIWSFAVEPAGYPIPGSNISVRASSFDTDKGPENTVNGSGLDGSGLLHGKISRNTMWLSLPSEPNTAWIQYEFDRIYKLNKMWVWNFNAESILSMYGLKEVTIEHSIDGSNWIKLDDVTEFEAAPGTDGYAHNTTVEFNDVPVRYVRITAVSNQGGGGFFNQYGLSEVRFFNIPVSAREPSPAAGAANVALDVTLSWRAGREAVTHDVYISDRIRAVLDRTADLATVSEPSYGPLDLDLGTTYYWSVDEVNGLDLWESDIWSFTTEEYFVLDDFESYDDFAPNEIWRTWVDGYNDSGNGSTAGYPDPEFAFDEHYVETAVVHGGDQSMPYFYDNTTAGKSEVTSTMTSYRDWTQKRINALSLWYIGDENNVAEPMYVTLNGSATVNNDDATAALATDWTEWRMDLQDFADQGLDLSDVSTVTIGFGDGSPGGSGLVFIDDIRVYGGL